MAAYYLLREDGQPEGPIRKTEICRMVESGEVGPDDQVAASQFGPWTRVAKIPQLAALLPGAGAPPGASGWVPQGNAPQQGWSRSPGPGMSSQQAGWGPPGGSPPPGGGWGPPGGPQGRGGWGMPPIPPVTADGPSPLLAPARMVESVVNKLNTIAGSGLLDKLSSVASTLGHSGLLLGGASLTIFAVVFAMRTDSLKLGLAAIAIPIVVAILQYGDWKFLDLCTVVVKNTPTKTSSLALYQFVALLLVVGAVAAIGGGVYAMVQLGGSEGRYAFLAALALALYLAIVGLLLLTPSALNLVVEASTSAGAEGISLIGTALKGLLAATRLVFGVMCGLGSLATLVGCLWFISDTMDPRSYVWGGFGLYLLALGALNPIFLYLVAVFYYIIPDVVIGVIRHTSPKQDETPSAPTT
jgi:hypothetical protein